jgi:hypothetical protein
VLINNQPRPQPTHDTKLESIEGEIAKHYDRLQRLEAEVEEHQGSGEVWDKIKQLKEHKR